MQSLTSGLGNSSNVNKGTINPQQVKRVLISRPNHRLGNLLLITPLVQEVQTLFPNATIDVFIKDNNIIEAKRKQIRAYGGCLGFWRRRKTW